ncbi:thymidylate synthase [Coleofasciculus sp. H7-2]|uniref:thymidylate synthase n=1 Tax=Coleofasciculus sp. H7-2 TaxID=3351545 RepID=UPI00366C376C
METNSEIFPWFIESDSANGLIRNLIHSVCERGEDLISPSISPNSGTRTREVLNVQATLSNPRARLFTSHIKEDLFNPGLAVAKFFYLLSGSNRIEDIAFYTKGAQKYTDDGIIMPGAHGYRIFYPVVGINQFDACAELLREWENTKRAAITLYQPEDCGRKTKDIPCIMSIVFSARKGKLHTTVYMRANEVYQILPYDLFEFTMFAEFMAVCTDFELGYYHHISTSMHIRGEEAIKEAPTLLNEKITSKNMAPMPIETKKLRLSLIQQENQIRKKVAFTGADKMYSLIQEITAQNHSYWADLLVALSIQGFFCTHTLTEMKDFISSLELPTNFLVSCELKDFSQKRLARLSEALNKI